MANHAATKRSDNNGFDDVRSSLTSPIADGNHRALLNRRNVIAYLGMSGLFAMAVVSLGAAMSVRPAYAGQDGSTDAFTHELGSADASASQDSLKALGDDGHVSIKMESSSNSSGNDPSQDDSSTTVTVNGQTESTSRNGATNIDKTYISNDGDTNVHISVKSNSTNKAGR